MSSRTKKALLLIVLGALAVRIWVLFAFDAHVIEDDWDFGWETGRIAKALATGEGFSSPFREPTGSTAWLMPAYPGLLAVIFTVFGVYSKASAVAILLFNSAVAAATCVAVYLVAERVFGSTTGLASAAIFALYPSSIWHSVNTIWDTSVVTLLALLLVHGLYLLERDRSVRAGASYGLALGASLWVSPLFLSVLPLAWVGLLQPGDRSLSRRLGAAAVLTLTAVLVVSPWLARNFSEFGRLYLKSTLGLELKLGNSEDAWADYAAGRNVAVFWLGHPSVVPEEFARYTALGEVRYVEEATSDAMRFMREHPIRFLRLTVRRFFVLWLSDLATPNDWSGSLDLRVPLSWAKAATHVVPLPFMVVGLIVAMRRRLAVGPLLGFLLLFPSIYYVTHVTERYRFPIEPFIVILATFGMLWLMGRATRVWRRTSAAKNAGS